MAKVVKKQKQPEEKPKHSRGKIIAALVLLIAAALAMGRFVRHKEPDVVRVTDKHADGSYRFHRRQTRRIERHREVNRRPERAIGAAEAKLEEVTSTCTSNYFGADDRIALVEIDRECDDRPDECRYLIYDKEGWVFRSELDHGCDEILDTCEEMTYDDHGNVATKKIAPGCRWSAAKLCSWDREYDERERVLTEKTDCPEPVDAPEQAACRRFEYQDEVSIVRSYEDRDCDGQPEICVLQTNDDHGNEIIRRTDEGCDGVIDICVDRFYDERDRAIGYFHDKDCNGEPDVCMLTSYNSNGDRIVDNYLSGCSEKLERMHLERGGY